MSNDFLGANFRYLVKLLREKLGNPFFFQQKFTNFAKSRNLRRDFIFIFIFFAL